jgi:Alpha 1,4-glycosyltransferase conserved region/Glycosyltransferase sugar-binding region containing DXD motif
MWIGAELSKMEQLCITSFLKNGHEFHLYAYDEVKNIPEGAVLKDAGRIIPPDKIFKNKDRDIYAGFSDLFRYKMLLENGNYWSDMDVICLRPFKYRTDYVFASSRVFKSPGNSGETSDVASCVIRVPPGSDVMYYCYEVSKNKNPHELEWGDIGPRLLRIAVKKFNMEEYMVGTEAFCPIDWNQWQRFISRSPMAAWIEMAKMALFRTRAVHLWNEMWRLDGTDKNASFPKNCIYERLKRRYLNDGKPMGRETI